MQRPQYASNKLLVRLSHSIFETAFLMSQLGGLNLTVTTTSHNKTGALRCEKWLHVCNHVLHYDCSQTVRKERVVIICVCNCIDTARQDPDLLERVEAEGHRMTSFTLQNRWKHVAAILQTTYHANCFVGSILRRYLPDMWNDLRRLHCSLKNAVENNSCTSKLTSKVLYTIYPLCSEKKS